MVNVNRMFHLFDNHKTPPQQHQHHLTMYRQTELADLCQDDRQDLRIFGGEWRLTGLQQLVSVSQVCTFTIVSRHAALLVSFYTGKHLSIFH